MLNSRQILLLIGIGLFDFVANIFFLKYLSLPKIQITNDTNLFLVIVLSGILLNTIISKNLWQFVKGALMQALLSVVCVAAAIISYWFLVQKFNMNFFNNEIWLPNLVFKLVVMLASIGVVSLYNFFILFYNDIDEQSNYNKIVLQSAKDAELNKLRLQLQPHFLYNSLNSISSLIKLKPDQARLMTNELSEFLRYTVNKDNSNFISLEEEIYQISRYLNIEKIRFGNRLQLKITVADALKKYIVPALILQPIIENAVKYGIYGTLDTVVIELNAEKINNQLHIIISNPFDADNIKNNSGEKFGLLQINRRLYLLYAQNNLLQTYQQKNIFFTKLIIPI